MTVIPGDTYAERAIAETLEDREDSSNRGPLSRKEYEDKIAELEGRLDELEA